ncbi:MAG: PKD domain-containing protein [Bacteroidota bacterium]
MLLNRAYNLLLLLGAIFIVGLASSCEDDEMPTPMPMTGEPPVAAFTLAVSPSDVLTIDFTNASTDATSFSWNFGDGNSSTEENPSHTYAAQGDYTVTLTATNSEGSDEASQSLTVQSPYRTSGFFMTSLVTTSAGTTYYGEYFEEEPAGDIDMTRGQAQVVYRIYRVDGPFMYGRPLVFAEPGLVKYAIDANTDQIIEIGRINTLDFPGHVDIISDELGFFSSFNGLRVTAFNPTTMQEIQTIDLETGSQIPTAILEDEDFFVGILAQVYNPATNRLLLTLQINNGQTTSFYDAPDTYLEVIDVATLTRVSQDIQPDAMLPSFRGGNNLITDDQNNTYFLAQGSYALDGNAGPTSPARSRPRILKVNADGTFDTDYAWNPIDALGFQNNFIQVFTSMVQADNGKVYGMATADTEPPRLLELLQIFATRQLSDAEFAELSNLVFASEAGRLVEIDLQAKTANFVMGAPLTAGYISPNQYNYDGFIYTQTVADNGTFNGFTKTNPETNETVRIGNITVGGNAEYLFRLGEE